LTAIFLLFEMTQNYTVTVPALITAIVGLMIATRLEPESIDTLGLTAEGKSLHATTDRQVLDQIPVAAVYRREAETIPERATLPEVLRIVAGSRSATFPVVSDAAGAGPGRLRPGARRPGAARLAGPVAAPHRLPRTLRRRRTRRPARGTGRARLRATGSKPAVRRTRHARTRRNGRRAAGRAVSLDG